MLFNDDAVLQAMGYLFTDTHNVAEGAGAAALAGLLADEVSPASRAAIVITGGNVNQALFREALARVA